MPVYSASSLDEVFVQAMTSLLVAPNTTGVWSSTGSILARHTTCNFTQNNPVAPTQYKTGNRSNPISIAGRKSGAFSFSAPLIPNGAAGVAPDLAPILNAIFGAPGTVVATTSVTYNFLDSGFLPFLLARFNLSGGTTPTHQFAGGCIPQRCSITMGGDYLMLSVDGKAVFASDSTQFASYTGNDLPAAFGLTAYPVAPTTGAPVTVSGLPINGFGGVATFDGNIQAEMRGAPVFTINTGLDFAEDGFTNAYPFAVIGGKRSVSLGSLKFIDDDGTALKNLKTKAFTKTPINISLQINDVAGSIVTINLGQVQLAAYQIVESGPAFDINFGDSMAHASSPILTNDATVVFT
jgi:hypothetical protein